MSKSCGIYMIECKVNGKKYIGQSTDMCWRWRVHNYALDSNRHINPYLQSAWNKYGTENFEFKTLCEEKEENLNELEEFIISELETFTDRTKGYNLTSGGEGQKLSEETREKIRLSKVGKKYSEYSRQKMRLSQIGKKQSEETINKRRVAMLGFKMTEESKRKIGVANKGKKRSEETKQRMRKLKLGKKHSEEHKRKMSLSGKGKHSGKKASEESKQKMREAKLGKKQSEDAIKNAALARQVAFWSKTVG